ncbi:hypothetical protein [Nocardioides litoris]|uniref:hypothetical protein n=1 Tax=Nocardioides litoris TaxID=1926648 RepID=UPI001123BC91|nr:hypothetical protein [Nocardioides litoris]
MSLTSVVLAAAPQDEDVVAGWTAFALFVALIVVVALLGVSLTRRLKNVDKAAEAGLYDPSDPKRERRATGLAAAREMHAQRAADDAAEDEQARHDADRRGPASAD